MKGREWSEDEMIPYVLAHKMMLTVNKTLPSLANDDATLEIPAAKEIVKKSGKKGGLKRKALARKPEKGILIKEVEAPAAKKPKIVSKAATTGKGKQRRSSWDYEMSPQILMRRPWMIFP